MREGFRRVFLELWCIRTKLGVTLNVWIKRIMGIFAAAVIFIVYFVISTKGVVYSPFTVFFPSYHYCFFVCAFVMILFFLFRNRVNIKIKADRILFFVLPITLFLWSLIYAWKYLQFVPQPDDGIHYVWLSKLLLQGRVYMELPEFNEHFQCNFITVHDGKFVSVFLPGFSLVMAPFTALGVPWLLNPILAGVNTYLVGKHALKLRDMTAAFTAMMLFVFSSVHIFHGALYFPHHFGLFIVLLSTYIIVHGKSSTGNIAIAGALVAYTLLVRPQNAVYVYAGFFVYFILFKKFRSLIVFTLPFLFFGGILMTYNWFFTGDPFYFVQDALFDVINRRKLCHRPGFGKGCSTNHGDHLPPGGTDLKFLAGINFLRLNSFLTRITAHPGLLFFIFPVVYKYPRKYFLYYFLPLCAVASYFFFYIEGNYAGPRYLMETGALFLVAAGCGISYVFELLRKNDLKQKVIKGIVAGFIISSVVFFSYHIFPIFVTKPPYKTPQNVRVKEIIEEKGIKNSIIMLPFCVFFETYSPLTIMDDPPYDKYGNLIMQSVSLPEIVSDVDKNILKYYNNSQYKAVWKFDEDKKNPGDFKVRKLEFLENDDKFIVEFEVKSIPVSGLPYFSFPIWSDYVENELGFFPGKTLPLRYLGLLLQFRKGRENWYGFEHSVVNSGDYQFELAYVASSCATGFDIEINGKQAFTVDPKINPEEVQKTVFEAKLKKGRNKFRIIPKKDGCIVLDYLDMELNNSP